MEPCMEQYANMDAKIRLQVLLRQVPQGSRLDPEHRPQNGYQSMGLQRDYQAHSVLHAPYDNANHVTLDRLSKNVYRHLASGEPVRQW